MSIWRNYDISGTTAKTSTEGVPTSTTTGPQISSPTLFLKYNG
jgi:hypothetical protein